MYILGSNIPVGESIFFLGVMLILLDFVIIFLLVALIKNVHPLRRYTGKKTVPKRHHIKK